MHECIAKGADTPGPHYKITAQETFKKRSYSVKFESVSTARLAKIGKTEQTDFFEVDAANKYITKKAPAVGFKKAEKISFLKAAEKKGQKGNTRHAYDIKDRAYNMLSPSPNARKR